MPVCWVRILEAVGEHDTLKENKVRPARGDQKRNKKVNSLFQRHQVLGSLLEERVGDEGEGRGGEKREREEEGRERNLW